MAMGENWPVRRLSSKTLTQALRAFVIPEVTKIIFGTRQMSLKRHHTQLLLLSSRKHFSQLKVNELWVITVNSSAQRVNKVEQGCEILDRGCTVTRLPCALLCTSYSPLFMLIPSYSSKIQQDKVSLKQQLQQQ